MFDVPFYIQQERNDCGPTALKMALEFLGEKHDVKELNLLVLPESNGATWTLSLAKSASQLGFRSEFYTTSLGFNPDNYTIDFYKTETDGADAAKQKLEKLKLEAVKYGVKMHEKSLGLKDILSKLSEDCVSIALLNWNIVKGISAGYQGHFVPIVGFDNENVYVHNQGKTSPTQNMAIKKEIFELARKSKGTDEDIVFIYRK